MPLGIERINVRKAQPNPNINFIKPLEGPHKVQAQDFLERVAAIAVPIMNANHIYVMSLEEFPPNDEFLGRNFNAGEVVQLILKNKSGGWLPFKFVERVLMHELAHCKQMNHSKAFYQVNHQYCAELKMLWEKGYTGEGMWSRGVLLANGSLVNDRPLAERDIPEHLCGGTFRSNKKRKRGTAEREKVSYQERQQRRILKKFGINGVALGADDEIKAKLEKGKRPVGKPRVAGSARGRELRAAAALARLEKPQVSTLDESGNSDTESDEEDVKVKPDDAKDINGHRLVDSSGCGMIKVCEDECDNADIHNEMEELRNLEYVCEKQNTSKAIKAPKASSKVPDKKPRTYSSYMSPRSTSGYCNYVESLIDVKKERKITSKVPHGNSGGHTSISRTDLQPNKTNTVKQEVFDILTDYLGDPTCNPEGAIYSGLNAARASMPRPKSEGATSSVNPSTKYTSSFSDNGIFCTGIGGIHTNEHSAASVKTPLIRSPPHNNHQAILSPIRSHLDNSHLRLATDDLRLINNHPVIYAELSSRTHNSSNHLGSTVNNYVGASGNRNSLLEPVGGIRRAKSDSHSFARAVEKHHREETIGVLQSPESSPKLPNSLVDSQRLHRTKSMYVPSTQSQQLSPLSRPAVSRLPLENVTNIPPTRAQHTPIVQERPNMAKPSTQAHIPTSQPPPISSVPTAVPRIPTPAPRPIFIPPAQAPVQSIVGECKVCTTINDIESLACMVCSNVLYPERDPFHWRCRSAVCRGTEYVNSGDYGVCGVCEQKKPL